MSRTRIVASLVAAVVTSALAIVVPLSSASPASAAACDYPNWAAGTQYYTGNIVKYTDGKFYIAEHDNPGYDPTISTWYWDPHSCDGGTPPPACDYPDWVAGRQYYTGNIVRYNGSFYIAEHDNPGYDPTISTWYWDPYTCGGTPPPGPGGFVVTEAQFNQMFPSRNSFYTYSGLVTAMGAFPAFAKTGSDTIKKQEAAAFLANVSHETGGLVHIVEQNQGHDYCDESRPYGCPAGPTAYYGRGPIQLSWNFNYKAAGDALGLDLLGNPWQVQNDAAISWKTALWYWMTQNGPGTMTAHSAMVNSRGFGETIRSINGSLECNGGNPGQVQSRVSKYQQFTSTLGVAPGGNLYC